MLTESFNELGEDPGVAFHETPLPGIARHGPGHTPPRSTSRSANPPAPAAAGRGPQQNPPLSVNPTSPRLLPDSLRAPSPAARRSTEGRSSHPGDVETAPQPLRIRSAFRRAEEGAGPGGAEGRHIRDPRHPGAGAGRGRGGAREGRGSLRPGPGAVLAFLDRRLFPALRRTSVGAAGPEHRLPGTGGSPQACCGPGNRVVCSWSAPGYSGSGRGALSSTGIPAAEARQKPSRPLLLRPPWSRTDFAAGQFGPDPVAPEGGVLGNPGVSAACKAPSRRACKGPFFSPSSCGFGIEALS